MLKTAIEVALSLEKLFGNISPNKSTIIVTTATSKIKIKDVEREIKKNKINMLPGITHVDGTGRLQTVRKENNIKYEMLYRCSVNMTFPLSLSPKPHKDHEFPHKHFLIYLNDSDGDTCVFNEDETEIEKRIKPEKHKGVCFENRLHYGELPTNGLRAIVAYTFI